MLFQRRRINRDELILHYIQMVTNVFQRRLINWDERGTGHNSVKKIVHTIPRPIVIAGTVKTPTTNNQFQYQYSFQYNAQQVTGRDMKSHSSQFKYYYSRQPGADI